MPWFNSFRTCAHTPLYPVRTARHAHCMSCFRVRWYSRSAACPGRLLALQPFVHPCLHRVAESLLHRVDGLLTGVRVRVVGCPAGRQAGLSASGRRLSFQLAQRQRRLALCQFLLLLFALVLRFCSSVILANFSPGLCGRNSRVLLSLPLCPGGLSAS